MKKKTVVLSGLVLLLCVAVVTVVFYASRLDQIIRSSVEKYGSEILQAEVRLKGVKINFTEGRATLNGLFIGNPDGFETSHLFKMESVSVDLDLDSIGTKTINIKEIRVQGPDIIYEFASGGSNIKTVQENIERYTGRKEEAAREDEEEGPLLIIDHIYITDGSVNISHNRLKGKKLSAPLPDIHLEDVGKDDGGASPGEVAARVMDSIKRGAQGAASSLNLGGLLEGAKEKMSGAGKAVKDGLDSAGEKLKGFFDRDK